MTLPLHYLEVPAIAAIALVGAMPVFLLVAAARRQKLSPAMRATLKFLRTWGGVHGGALKGVTSGVVAFMLLTWLAIGLSSLAQDRAPAAMSSWFSHFHYGRTQWAVQHENDWDAFKDRFKLAWSARHPDQNLVQPEKWEEWKVRHGRTEIRVARTLIWYAALLIIAGTYDIASRQFRNRGSAVLLLGIAGFVGAVAVWAGREDAYIRRVFAANQSLDKGMASLPPSLPQQFRAGDKAEPQRVPAAAQP